MKEMFTFMWLLDNSTIRRREERARRVGGKEDYLVHLNLS